MLAVIGRDEGERLTAVLLLVLLLNHRHLHGALLGGFFHLVSVRFLFTSGVFLSSDFRSIPFKAGVFFRLVSARFLSQLGFPFIRCPSDFFHSWCFLSSGFRSIPFHSWGFLSFDFRSIPFPAGCFLSSGFRPIPFKPGVFFRLVSARFLTQLVFFFF